MDEIQKYWFDSQGYFVVPNILNASEIEALKATMGPATEQHTPGQKEDNPLHWSAEWRALLDLPTLRPVLEALVGNHGFERIASVNTATTYCQPIDLTTLTYINTWRWAIPAWTCMVVGTPPEAHSTFDIMMANFTTGLSLLLLNCSTRTIMVVAFVVFPAATNLTYHYLTAGVKKGEMPAAC